MARRGNSIIKGIEINEIITVLNKAYADEWLAYYQYFMGGTPLLNPQDWFTHSNCGYEEPKEFDVVSLLEDSIKGEQCAISIYSKLVDMTREKDIVTYDIVSEILADEVEHEEDLQSLHDDITEFVADIKKKIN